MNRSRNYTILPLHKWLDIDCNQKEKVEKYNSFLKAKNEVNHVYPGRKHKHTAKDN